ncbi:MAG: hypothetical protein ACKN97_01145, partial [Acidobacteriota bacterium]
TLEETVSTLAPDPAVESAGIAAAEPTKAAVDKEITEATTIPNFSLKVFLLVDILITSKTFYNETVGGLNSKPLARKVQIPSVIVI